MKWLTRTSFWSSLLIAGWKSECSLPGHEPPSVDETVDDESACSGGRDTTYRRIARAVDFKIPEMHYRILVAS